MIDAAQFFLSASDRFAAQCETATADQWVDRPSPSDWSMGDVAEHLTIVNSNIAKRLSALSMLGEGRSDVIDEEIPYLFYRGDEPPNVAPPTGAWNVWENRSGEYRRSVRAVEAAAAGAQFDFRKYGARHPIFGMLDGVQWIMFAGSHTERHRSQLIGLLRSYSA